MTTGPKGRGRSRRGAARGGGTGTPPAAVPVPKPVVEHVLLGPSDDRRQLQDSPILGDVWIAFAENPGKSQDLLITPYKVTPAGKVARIIAERRRKFGRPRTSEDRPSIAYLQGIVAARLYFDELMKVVIPLTNWFHEKQQETLFQHAGLPEIEASIRRVLSPGQDSYGHAVSPSSIDRYVALAGLLLWAPDSGSGEVELEALAQLDHGAIAQRVVQLFEVMRGPTEQGLVWQISLNRRASPALDKSVPAVKADAAKTLFSVKCDEISWAVLDSGIDKSHPAFRDADGNCRVKQTFDFRHIRDIISLDNLDEDTRRERRAEIVLRRDGPGAAHDPKREEEDLAALEVLATDAEEGRPIHWELVERFIEVKGEVPPASPHGTHVAGILGGCPIGSNPGGMCSDINLYDFRILSKSIEDTEFAIIAALQYIRHLNGRSSFVPIHGVNLSLSIPHDVRNFACGRTPICNECERLVDNGVVVVAAAGNRGYQKFETRDGAYESYAAFSVTDPGNADGVITVGATHRYWPHTYGVSFFSSRGPTGDGRPKPDLVAPGERIRAPLPGNSWGELDGTSMAAPHVSGAAAMLMARYSELIGRPRRIKEILCNTATDLGRERSFQGHGMLDVLRAFQSI
jgi:serine protease AprX